ncbi:MAG: M48 family metalloprotease [Prolixibacteraceae bacterium]|nr:M48 family metalloprotease [Prolixibacteraceae bacterium]
MSEQLEQTRSIFNLEYGLGTQVGVMLVFSRLHEYEADKLGLLFLTMAGSNPEEAVSFRERMSKLGGASVSEFLSTHPISGNRVAEL